MSAGRKFEVDKVLAAHMVKVIGVFECHIEKNQAQDPSPSRGRE